MGPDIVNAAFLHFYHLDKSNAPIHLSEVRFSPITFEFALALWNAADDSGDDVIAEVAEVMRHRGTYPLDKGRIELDDSGPG